MDTTTSKHVAPSRRVGKICVHDTSVSVWEEYVDEPGIRLVFRSMLARLNARGWKIERDHDAVKNYTAIADWIWSGRKGDLEVRADCHGRVARVEFFQNVANVENRNGGRYDFDKIQKMPRRLRTLCIVEMTAVADNLRAMGYALDEKITKPGPLLRVVRDAAVRTRDWTTPLGYFNDGWGADRFRRDERGWPAPSEYAYYASANLDRDGVPILPMETRYFRHWDGRLRRATVFPNMNEMWAAHFGGEVAQMNRGELFMCERPDLELRRVKGCQAKRVREELDKAMKANDYDRVSTLARICKTFVTARPSPAAGSRSHVPGEQSPRRSGAAADRQ